MITFTPDKQTELAPSVEFNPDLVSAPRYGRSLEDFIPGQVFVHPRGQTIDRSQARFFATTFHQANPLFINAEYAKDMGFADAPVSPQHVFNVGLSLGVQNDSEKAIANLGYYDARFLRPVYPGDTIRSLTKVIDRRDRGLGKPGIATIRTLGLNQRDEVVLQYQRKIMVPRATDQDLPEGVADAAAFPWQEVPEVHLPALMEPAREGLTDGALFAEDFSVGQVILHFAGRTITDEHMAWSYGVGNTHPLHSDQVYSQGLSGKMAGLRVARGPREPGRLSERGLGPGLPRGLPHPARGDRGHPRRADPCALRRGRARGHDGLPGDPAAHRREEHLRRGRARGVRRGSLHQGDRQEGPRQGEAPREGLRDRAPAPDPEPGVGHA